MGNKMGRGGFAEPLGENASHSSSAKAQGLLETREFLKYIHFFGPKPQNLLFFFSSFQLSLSFSAEGN